MKKTNATLFITLLLSAPFITACTESNMKHTAGSSTNHSAKPQSAAALLPTMKWQLISHQASGQTPSNILKAGDAANRYHVSITGNRLNISGGCNAMSGMLTLGSPNTFTVGPMMATKRACMGTLMRSDAEVSGYLSRVNHYAINNQTLVLTTNNGEKLQFKGLFE